MNTSERKERSAQVLMDIRHGAHITEDTSPPAVELAATREDITPLKDAVVVEPEEVLFETRFDYLFPELATDPAAHLPADDPAKIAAVVAGLKPSAMRWWRIR
jgi:hypothetical protein